MSALCQERLKLFIKNKLQLLVRDNIKEPFFFIFYYENYYT